MIKAVFFLGPEIEYRIEIAGGSQIDVAVPSGREPLAIGTQTGLQIDAATVSLFDPASGQRVATDGGRAQ